MPTTVEPGVVLIVDDHDDIRESLGEVLEEEGYEVALAANGREALRYLHAHEPPCLILLAPMMPVMNGYEFRSAQQQDPALAGIPVAVVSGREDAAPSAREMDAVKWFAKPVDLDALLETVADHCACASDDNAP